MVQLRSRSSHPVGQILRNATALAAITGTAIVVNRVREGRSQPGLRPQHLTGLRLLDAICGEQGGLAAGGEVRSGRG